MRASRLLTPELASLGGNSTPLRNRRSRPGAHYCHRYSMYVLRDRHPSRLRRAVAACCHDTQFSPKKSGEHHLHKMLRGSKRLEKWGIDPHTSRMLSERSTI
ncbi:hypothetical protein M758_4G240000 [Ceratodon purpureus]|nr:hypothetical protein M758_4G240000 [Ceratodon purpureus]